MAFASVKSSDTLGNIPEMEEYPDYFDGPKPSKKKRYIAIAIFAVLFLVTVAITLVVFLEEAKKPSGNRFSFDDIFNPDLKVQRKGVRWIQPDGTLTYLSNSDIYLQKLPSEVPYIFVKGSDIIGDDGKPLEFSDYWLSIDEQYLLLATQYQKVWRHSFTAVYYIYSVNSKKLQLVTPERTQYAEWSPTGHALAYVVNNDIYILKDDHVTNVRVTTDGSLNAINGIPAWVYEEEIFGTNYALWWSPASDKIAFLRSDETNVDIFYMTKYGKGAYPTQIPIKYPKPGYTNPTAELKFYYIESGNTASIDFNFGEESLIVQVGWISNESLAARLTNRVQNLSKFYRVEASTLIASVVSQQSSANGWVDYSELFLIPNSNQYLELIDYNGYNHIALYNYGSLTPVPITEGNWEVSQIAGFNAKTRTAYYLSTEADVKQRHLYAVNIDVGVSSRVKVTDSPGFYSVSFSPDSGFYLLNYNGPDIPYQRLRSTNDPNLNIILENNDALREKLSTYALPERRYITVPIKANGITDKDYEINCVMILPPDFDEREPRKYSVLHRVYGGPASNLVQETFVLDWHTYLASSEEYIVTMCDARGTAGRGNAFKHAVYKNLGEYEAYDQIEASKFIQAYRYTRIDNTVVWGWSYGGYLTSKILEAGSGIFVGGIAVAPVTDWRYYDTVYTERYMLTPQTNEAGYTKSAVSNFSGLNGTEYLLVHGTADDNVHFQHTLVLIDQLTQANVDFDIHIYTDSDHAINTGANTQRDLYRRFTDYLLKLQ